MHMHAEKFIRTYLSDNFDILKVETRHKYLKISIHMLAFIQDWKMLDKYTC